MGKKVHLTVTGRQTDETGNTTVTTRSVQGEAYEKNGSLYLLYEDSAEENGPPVKNVVKLKGSSLELTKKGGISTRMVFQPDREYLTDYATPLGCLKIGILTRSLEISAREVPLKIKITYTLTWEGKPFSDCVLTIDAASPD